MGEWTDLIRDYVAYLQLRNYARRTLSDYRTVVQRFNQHFPDVPIQEVTTGHIEQYLAARPLSPRSREVELEKLRAFFKYLTKHRGLLETNPCTRVDRPRWQPRIRPAPTRAEVVSLLDACQTKEERDFVASFYFTGLRISELLSLRGRNVDLANRRIQVVGKGGHERKVMFPPSLVDLLASRVRGPDVPLFPTRRFPNSPTYDRWVNRILIELGKRAGLPYKLTAHLLRHAYFRMLKTQGVPVEVAARLGGHRSIQTTVKVYGRLDDDDLQLIYDKHIDGVSDIGVPNDRVKIPVSAALNDPPAKTLVPQPEGDMGRSSKVKIPVYARTYRAAKKAGAALGQTPDEYIEGAARWWLGEQRKRQGQGTMKRVSRRHEGPRRRASSSKPSARKTMPKGSGRVSDSRRISSNSSTV